MERVRVRARAARTFVSGNYGGAPVDYLMAIAIVYAAMVVLVVNNLIRGI